jgi:hypothetical protein
MGSKVVSVGLLSTFVFVGAMEVMGNASKTDNQPSSAPASSAVAPPTPSEPAVEAKAAPVPETGRQKRITLTNLNAAERQVRLVINLSGNLCAKPVEVRPVDENLFGVSCITNRDGSGLSNYLVNTDNNEVTEI